MRRYGLLMVLAGSMLCAACDDAGAAKAGFSVYRDSYAGVWPFTVSQVVVDCETADGTIKHAGQIYRLDLFSSSLSDDLPSMIILVDKGSKQDTVTASAVFAMKAREKCDTKSVKENR